MGHGNQERHSDGANRLAELPRYLGGFAKIKYPSISTDSIRTWLKQKRIAEIEAFLS